MLLYIAYVIVGIVILMIVGSMVKRYRPPQKTTKTASQPILRPTSQSSEPIFPMILGLIVVAVILGLSSATCNSCANTWKDVEEWQSKKDDARLKEHQQLLREEHQRRMRENQMRSSSRARSKVSARPHTKRLIHILRRRLPQNPQMLPPPPPDHPSQGYIAPASDENFKPPNIEQLE